MKKTLIIIFTVLGLIFMGGALFMLINLNKYPTVLEFNLVDYEWEATTFSSEKNVGEVNDAKTAIKKAEGLWIEKFSDINGEPYNPINGRKIEVSFDSKNECWHINGTLASNMLGSVPHALIKKNGNVIAVWMG